MHGMNTFTTQVPSTVTHTHDEDCSDDDETKTTE